MKPARTPAETAEANMRWLDERKRNNPPEVALPIPTLMYATHLAGLVTPPYRTAGFADSRERGHGDLLDAVGTFIVFEQLALAGKRVSCDLTAGQGDKCDLTLEANGVFTTWNVKASSFAPFHSGLHLFVKEEEAGKSVTGFVQVFVHLGEGAVPHVHLAGFCGRKKLLESGLREIPGTGGHMGFGVPVGDLRSFGELVDAAAGSVFRSAA